MTTEECNVGQDAVSTLVSTEQYDFTLDVTGSSMVTVSGPEKMFAPVKIKIEDPEEYDAKPNLEVSEASTLVAIKVEPQVHVDSHAEPLTLHLAEYD